MISIKIAPDIDVQERFLSVLALGWTEGQRTALAEVETAKYFEQGDREHESAA